MDIKEKRQIIEKIRALAAKTVENGATEAEAASAAAMAEKLMRQHALSMEDLDEVASDSYGAGRRRGPNWYRGDKYRNKNGFKIVSWHHVSKCYPYIARFCNVKWWVNDYTREIVFFGSALDVELAFYLADVIKAAMDGEWRSYQLEHSTNKGKAGFMLAMGHRLNERLAEMSSTRDREKAVDPNGKYALVLVKKDAIVDDRFRQYTQQKGLSFSSRSPVTPSLKYHNAIRAGRAAGDRVGFHRPVEGAQGPKLLN